MYANPPWSAPCILSGMNDPMRVLNDLIATCRDSEEGFGKAAKGVHSDHLRLRFTGIARQRADFADELAELVKKAGGAPAESGHQSGIQQRGWRELEASIRPKDDPTFIRECDEGEQNTLRHYEHALTEELPTQARPVVERQRLAVQATLMELSSMEQLRS